MKLDDFKKYKMIAESADADSLQNYPDAVKIHKWMEETGRIDEGEGFFGSIWGWLKKNFSIRGRRIHTLADEYEKELYAETKAEWFKIKDKADQAAKFRAGNYAKLSRDIREKMDIVAEDDADYQELVRALINEKDLLVKKSLISAYSGVMDPDDVKELTSTNNRDLKDAKTRLDDATRTLLKPVQDAIKDAANNLKRRIGEKRSYYSQARVDGPDESLELGKHLAIYINALSGVDKTVKLDNKTVVSYAKKFVDAVIELSKKLESSDVSKEEAIDAVKEGLYKEMLKVKPSSFDKIKADAFIDAKKTLEGGTDDAKVEAEDELTTTHTDVVVDKKDVKDAIKDVASDLKKPTVDNIVEKIESSVSKYLLDNLSRFTKTLNSKIEKFNSTDETKREKALANFEYELDSDNKLKLASESDVKALMKNFIEIAGAIVPFYQRKEDTEPSAAETALSFMFEIYAVKKTAEGKLKQADIDTIVDNVKVKFPDEYK